MVHTPPNDAPGRARAFTLVELLVVVAVIVVLLSLLAPALDKAVYQAELTVCGTHLHDIAVGVHQYTFQFKRQYPYRNGVQTQGSWTPQMLAATQSDSVDDRKPLRGYINLNGHLNCPLTG